MLSSKLTKRHFEYQEPPCLRNIQNSVSRLSDLERLSRSMEQDIISYKTMFEKNNYTLAIMSENVEDQIFSLSGRLEELDLQGKVDQNLLSFMFTF